MNNKDGELTEEEYREVIKYGRGMLINIIIGVVAAVVIAVYMGMLKKGVVFLMLLLPLRQYCGGYHMKNHNKCIVVSIIKSSPNLCVNSSFSYVVLSTLLLSSRDLTEWSLVYHNTLSYQRFYDLHSIHYDHLEGLHQLI